MNPRIYLYIFFLLFLSACQNDGQTSLLEQIKANKEIVVVTRNAPTTYYYLHDKPTGIEFELTQAFAKSLGVEVRYLIKDSTSDILTAIQTGEAQLAAAGLTRTTAREAQFLFGPTYQEVQQQVVCRRGGPNPKDVSQLQGIKMVIPVDTSYEERLTELQKRNADLNWQVGDDWDTELILEKVWRKKIKCTVADSNIVAINRRYYPELKVRFNLTKPEPLAWVMPEHASDLQDELEDWFEEFKDKGELEALLERYYGYIDVFDYVDTRKFVHRIHKVLPKYKTEFKQAAKKYDLDWLLLAAQAYQESHWRANAKSPTGVRGIMMLTQSTAKEVGIKRRIDAKQSIYGGAKYLSRLTHRIPDSVTGHDREWFALAAYNVGMGHIHDARTLAKRLDKNPDVWHDLSEVLPLLSQKKYYKSLKYGYARGREPVTYVQRIRDYHNILHNSLGKIN